MHMLAWGSDGYSVSLDEAEVFLERLEQVAHERTGGRTPCYGGVPRVLSVQIHHPDGRLLVGTIVWDVATKVWTVTNDELGRFAWECCAQMGRI